MQICMPDFIELRLWRWRHHDEIFVLVAAALNLVRCSQDVDKNLEMPAAIAASRIAKVSVGLEHRLRNTGVVSFDHVIERRLRSLPKIRDIRLFIEARQKR